MLNLILMLLWAASGFSLGVLILGAVPALRSHPRYLMAAGATVMPLLWAFHLVIPARPLLFGPDLLFMMAGVGMIVSGWEAEVELEEQLVDERRKRLRAAWESRQVRPVDPLDEDTSPAGTASSASAPTEVDSDK